MRSLEWKGRSFGFLLAVAALAGCARPMPGILPGQEPDGCVPLGPDASAACSDLETALELDLQGLVRPVTLPGGVQARRFAGTVVRHGPAGSDAGWEVVVAADSGAGPVRLRYRLPSGRRLPLRVGRRYEFEFRVRWGRDLLGRGLLVRNVRDERVVFLGEAGPVRTFTGSNAVRRPFDVEPVPRTDCPPVTGSCGRTEWSDRLRFSGAGAWEQGLALAPGQQGLASGAEGTYQVEVYAARHWDGACPGSAWERVSYSVSLQEDDSEPGVVVPPPDRP